jgi:rhamnosyl/mannosyltransferase
VPAPLHILHVYKDYPPVLGGIELHVRDLAAAQAARGHAVTVLVTGPGTETRRSVEDGVLVIRCPRIATVASTPLSPLLAVELARAGARITHVHIPYPVAEAAWLARETHPMVASYHSDVVRQRVLARLWAPFLRRLLDRADRVLAGSPTYARTSPFLEKLANVTIVPYGIDPEPFAAAADVARSKDPAPRAVLFVGRLRYYKGVDVLLRALAPTRDVTLSIVGTGALEAHLRELSGELGMGERVRWLGDVPAEELPDVYAAHDVFVLPAVARSEAFGIVQLEAMAAGLPVVTTELGTGTSWVTRDRETGLVVPPSDVDALRAAVLELLDHPDMRRAYGAAGRARVRAEFTIERMRDRVEAVYESLAAPAS